MTVKLLLAVTCVVITLALPPAHLRGDGPSADGDGNATTEEFDPFAANPRIDRFRWQEQLSIQKSLVAGSDVVLRVSPNEIALAAGNEFMIDEETVFVTQSPGATASPAGLRDISVGTPISYEIDITKGGAARRVVVWRGFGPGGHKIYWDRIEALIRPVWKRGVDRQQFELDHPEESMRVSCGSTSNEIAPGVPQLLQLETPQKSVEIVCGVQTQTISTDEEFSAFLAFRSYGDVGLLMLVK